MDTRPVPSVTSSADFGPVTVGQVANLILTLTNPRLTTVALTGNPRVEILGEHTSDFEVIVHPGSEIPAGGSVTFEIRFAPTQLGRPLYVSNVQLSPTAPSLSPSAVLVPLQN